MTGWLWAGLQQPSHLHRGASVWEVRGPLPGDAVTTFISPPSPEGAVRSEALKDMNNPFHRERN